METIIDILVFIFGVLSLILFFKLWKMCNNVKEIAASIKDLVKNTAPEETKQPEQEVVSSSTPKFEVSQLVIIKEDESQFRITKIHQSEEGGFLYYSDKYNKSFKEDEIEDFKVYWNNKK